MSWTQWIGVAGVAAIFVLDERWVADGPIQSFVMLAVMFGLFMFAVGVWP